MKLSATCINIKFIYMWILGAYKQEGGGVIGGREGGKMRGL